MQRVSNLYKNVAGLSSSLASFLRFQKASVIRFSKAGQVPQAIFLPQPTVSTSTCVSGLGTASLDSSRLGRGNANLSPCAGYNTPLALLAVSVSRKMCPRFTNSFNRRVCISRKSRTKILFHVII